MKRKVCIVLTYRGNYGKMKSTMQEVEKSEELELQIVVGGAMMLQKFGQPVKLLHQDGFREDEAVYFLLEGDSPVTMAKSTGNAVSEFANTFERLQPDMVVVVADRFEAMAIAIAASYMNIPLVHLEGGELSGSIDESIRHAITKFAHYHLVATKKSSERVVRMGEDATHVHVVGSPNLDLIAGLNLDLNFNPFAKYLGVGPEINCNVGEYIIVNQHPVTTEYERAAEQIFETLHSVYELDIPTLWLWPNMDAGSDGLSKGIRIFRERYLPEKIHFFKFFSFEDYATLINNCAVLIGNTSSGIRESCFLGVPVVNIGTRQNYRERGDNVVDCGYDREEIKQAILKQKVHGRYEKGLLYGDGTAGKKIVKILARCELTAQKTNMY